MKIIENKIRHSFDVFDTCLARLWAEPSDLFSVIGQHLQQLELIKCEDVKEFTRYRRQAELEAWRNYSFKKQPSLEEIYQNLASNFNWDTDELLRAQQAEVELEIACLMPISETLATINQIHDTGQSVAYISDMYLPKDVVFEILHKNGFWREGDKLFVSSEVGVRKHNGRLYQLVQKDLGCSWFSILHTGDNFRSDFVMAWLTGFRGQHFKSGLLHSREKKAMKGLRGNAIGSRLAAVSRLTRVSYSGSKKHKNLWDVTVTGFSPLIFSFAFHCLIKAKEKGYSDIYFCSRDGSLPMKIAKIINDTYNFGLNIHYLLSSRASWCKTALTGENPIGLKVALQGKELTLRNIAEKLGLGENSYKRIQTFFGEEVGIDESLSCHQIDILTKGFESGFLNDDLANVETHHRYLCMSYFKEVGMDFAKGFLLVDGFSRGTVEALFNGMVASSGIVQNKSEWVYLELLDDDKRNQTNSFLPAFNGKSPFSRVALAEALLATNELPFTHFQITEGKLSPVFGNARPSSDERVVHDLVHQACIRFTEWMCSNIALQEIEKPQMHIYAINAFDSLVNNPTKEEARSLSKLSFESWNKKPSLAKSVGLRDFLKTIRWRYNTNKSQLILDGCWMEGSLALSNTFSRFLFKFLIYK